MAQIKTEEAYNAAMSRIEELLNVITDTPDDPNMYELDLLTELVEEYEDIHYPIGTPELTDVIKTRLSERGLTQKAAAELLGISTPYMSELMNGKSEPSLSLARTISQKLDIEPAIVLGV